MEQRPEDPVEEPWRASAPQTPTPYAPRSKPVGRPGVAGDEPRQWAMFAHLSALACVLGVPPFIGPLVVWLVKKDTEPFVDDQGKEALNFGITMTIAWAAIVVLVFLVVGLFLLPVLLVFQILFPVLGGLAANRGEAYRYPVTFRFIT